MRNGKDAERPKNVSTQSVVMSEKRADKCLSPFPFQL